MINEFTLKNSITMLSVISIVTLFGVYFTYANYPNALYQIASSILLATVIFFWKTTDNRFRLLLLSLLWYALFWSIRDSIIGFYTPEQKYEDFLALWPTVLAFTSYPSNKPKWWQYVLTTAIHFICIMMVNETDNEVLLIMAVLSYPCRKPFYEQFIIGGFIWYQTFLTVSKYTSDLWRGCDIIYFVALTPYLITLLFAFFYRIQNK